MDKETNKKINFEELLKEFADLYKNPKQNIPSNVEAIIVLAGDKLPIQGENISRIKYAVILFKKINKNIPIIFSGIVVEEKNIINLMINLGIPKENCYFQDCSKLGISNTKTQFENLATDHLTKDLKNLVFVTSTYHIPRVKRTANKILPPKTHFTIVADPTDWKIYNTFLLVIDEIEKIIKYSAKGDILSD